MTDKEVVEELIEKFKMAKERREFDNGMNDCVLCEEFFDFDNDPNWHVKIDNGCDKCLKRYGEFFGFTRFSKGCHHCMTAKFEGCDSDFGEALEYGLEWQLFRKQVLKHLKAKLAEL